MTQKSTETPKKRGTGRQVAPSGGTGTRKQAGGVQPAKKEKPWFHPDSPLRAQLLEELMKGATLRTVCQKIDGLPYPSYVLQRTLKDPDFAEQYTQARLVGYMGMADDILEIADNGSNDWMADNDPENPGYVHNGEHTRRSHMRIEARKWMLSKMLPKVFGDKVQHQHNVNNVDRIQIEFIEPPADRPRAQLVDGQWVDITPKENSE